MSEMLSEPDGLELLKAIDDRKTELLIAAGFSKEDPEGNDVADYDALKQSGALAVARAVVSNRDDRAKLGVSQGDLYAIVLPDAPGADGATPDDFVDQQVKLQLSRFLWGITQVAPNGYVQRQLGDGRVLVRAKVHRGHDPIVVAYVTESPELLLSDSLQPEIDSLVKRANKLHTHAAMIVTRQPALAGNVAKAITTGTKRASNDARLDLPELPAGEEQ
jgi:hypothetical protein